MTAMESNVTHEAKAAKYKSKFMKHLIRMRKIQKKEADKKEKIKLLEEAKN